MKRLLNSIAFLALALVLATGPVLAQEAQPAAQPLPETTQPQPEPQPAALPQAQPLPQSQSLYRINGGDTLHISVYGEKDLDRDVAVEPDGGIAFPLVGNMNARGLTLSELQKKIADA